MVRTIEIPGARVRARDPRDDRLVEVGTSSPQLLLLLSDSGDPRSCLPQNATLVADALALRPAERTVIARLGATAIVIVPSRVDDLFALTRCILTPVVDALTFRIASEPPWLGRLAHKLSSNIGFSEVALLHETGAGLEPLAVGDLSLPALAAADGFILVPSECEGYPQGGVIEIFPILE
jgi:molybdopterin biosynthesis enzyme